MKRSVKYIYIISILILIISLDSCKKDYPNDIPKWLKDEIKRVKKEKLCEGDNTHRDVYCPTISEWTKADTIKYVFEYSYSVYNYYDYEGVSIGGCAKGNCRSCCPEYTTLLYGFSRNRLIWSYKK